MGFNSGFKGLTSELDEDERALMLAGRFTIGIVRHCTRWTGDCIGYRPVQTSPRRDKSLVLTGVKRRLLSLLVRNQFKISTDPFSRSLQGDDIKVDVKKQDYLCAKLKWIRYFNRSHPRCVILKYLEYIISVKHIYLFQSNYAYSDMFRLEGVIIRLFVGLYRRYIKYSACFGIPKMCTVLDVHVSTIWFNEQPDDDSFGSKHVAICII